MADILFLLRPGFPDPGAGPGAFYCPGCAAMRGLLAYYPQLQGVLDVREVGFPRPRAEVAALLGPDHPGCPLLILDPSSPTPDGVPFDRASSGLRYVFGSGEIGMYLSAVHGIAAPHP